MTELPERGVDPGWLALREPADAEARELTAGVVIPPLLAWLAGSTGPDQLLRVVDLGAGTGANPRWLAPRLADPGRQHWTLVDHDPRLDSWAPVRTASVRADVGELAQLLTDAGAGGVHLVTATALLDLLSGRQLTAIVDAVVTAVLPALFSLTVTGEVQLDPADRWDGALAAAFDAHQRRGGRPGPDAGAELAVLFRDRGWRVIEAPAPWLLRAGQHSAVIGAWLDGRVQAAVEQQPALVGPAADWLARRKAQLSEGALAVAVGHVEVLALPVPGSRLD